MSGHSQFKNIMYRKGAQDAKKHEFLPNWLVKSLLPPKAACQNLIKTRV